MASSLVLKFACLINWCNLFLNYANSKTSYVRLIIKCWIIVSVIWKQVTPANYVGQFLEPNLLLLKTIPHPRMRGMVFRKNLVPNF